MELKNAENKRVIEICKGGHWSGKCLVVKQLLVVVFKMK